MTNFDHVAPTAGDQGNSFEWLWDINVGSAQAPIWTNVPDMTGLTPNATPKLKDGTTYANKGQTSQSKVGEDFTLGAQVKGVRDLTGEFQPELVALIEAADAIGGSNVLGYRYYHATSPSLAYQGTAAVSWSRVNTGNDDVEFFSFDLAGQGDRHKIVNPAAGPRIPVIDAAEPGNAFTGDAVVLRGANLSGVTAVTVGGTAASDLTPITGGLIITLPAGVAGPAPIIATNPEGPSVAFPYTRGGSN